MIIEQYAIDYINDLNKLPEEKKIIIGVYNLARHLVCVEQFDICYNQSLLNEYLIALNGFFDYLQGIKNNLIDKKRLISLAPDTDDYPETEGTIAQNAFGAAYYLRLYIENNDNKNLLQSLDKSFESVDAMKYNKGTEEEENKYFSEESKKMKVIYEKSKKMDTTSLNNIDDVIHFARSLPLK